MRGYTTAAFLNLPLAQKHELVREVNIEDIYTQEQLDDMRVAFETFDLDGSGDIDSDELGLVPRRPRAPRASSSCLQRAKRKCWLKRHRACVVLLQGGGHCAAIRV